MNEAAKKLRTDITKCKEAESLLRQAEGIMRSIGWSIDNETGQETIAECLRMLRARLGEVLEVDDAD